MVTWRLLNTEPRDGAWNMAVDEVLWRGVQKGTSPPTIRFFAWDPPTLSLGYGQSVKRDLDMEALERFGIPLVRRPTGGRAVFHDMELTYSIVFPEGLWTRNPVDNFLPSLVRSSTPSSPPVPPNVPILRDYAAISLSLAAGLRYLGVEATLASSAYRVNPRDRSGSCFSSTSAFEVMTKGRKIVGSAQRRGAGGILQHGSILLDLDVDKLASLFWLSNEGARAKLANNLRKKTISVREALGGRLVSHDEARAALEKGFCDLAGELVVGSLTPEELKEVFPLAKEKKEEFRVKHPKGSLNR